MLPASISTLSPTTAPSRTTAPSPTTTPRPLIESDTLAPRSTLAPYSGLPGNGVAMAAWQNLETMQRVNLDVVQAFVNDYMVPIGTKSVAPEPNVP